MDSRKANVPPQARGKANPPHPESEPVRPRPDEPADAPHGGPAATGSAVPPPAPAQDEEPRTAGGSDDHGGLEGDGDDGPDDPPDDAAATAPPGDGGDDPALSENAAESEPGWRRSYREVAGIPEFRYLWSAHLLSITGNFLLNVAVTVLVYQQTSSALAAGVTLALTFVPPLVAGPLLSGLADLFPRRRVMVVCDVIRALLVVAVGIPGLPIWALWCLLFLSILPTVPFSAARAAMMAEIVQGDRYVAANAIIQLTSHTGTLVGLAAGGWIVSVIGANSAVMYNGATFLVSALIVYFGVHHRPAAHDSDENRPSLWEVTRDGTRLVFGDARLRTLGLFAWLAGLYMMPYGLANPLADQVGGGAAAAGLIMAGPSMGAVVGGFVLTRLINPVTRMHLLGPLAVVASAPLLGWLTDPPLWAMVTLMAICGAAASYQFVANAAFVLCVPPEGRGLAFGLIAAGLQATQGIGIALASLLVEITSTQVVIVVAGIIGVLGALVLATQWSRVSGSAIEAMKAPSPAAT